MDLEKEARVERESGKRREKGFQRGFYTRDVVSPIILYI